MRLCITLIPTVEIKKHYDFCSFTKWSVDVYINLVNNASKSGYEIKCLYKGKTYSTEVNGCFEITLM